MFKTTTLRVNEGNTSDKSLQNLNHLLIVHLLMHVLAFCHVENVARNQQAIEDVQVEEAEEVYQEQQQQEFEVADQVEEQALDSNSANPDLQQGKHRCMINPIPLLQLSLTITTIFMHYVYRNCLIPSCMRQD